MPSGELSSKAGSSNTTAKRSKVYCRVFTKKFNILIKKIFFEEKLIEISNENENFLIKYFYI